MDNGKESVTDYIAGIMSVLGDSRFIRGYERPGVGKIITSENAMIFTNRRIMFITVLLPGAETEVMGADVPMFQWVIAKKAVENRLKDLLSSMTPEQVLNSNTKNFYIDYDSIEEVKFGKFSQEIKIIEKNRHQLKYSIRDAKDFQKAKTLLANFIKDNGSIR